MLRAAPRQPVSGKCLCRVSFHKQPVQGRHKRAEVCLVIVAAAKYESQLQDASDTSRATVYKVVEDHLFQTKANLLQVLSSSQEPTVANLCSHKAAFPQ